MSHTHNFNTYNVPCFSQEPPPLSTLYALYQVDPTSTHLRFGQWFYNRYLGSVQGDKRVEVDKLHAAQNAEDAMGIIINLYKDYQWPI
jgi:hypothetical protein